MANPYFNAAYYLAQNSDLVLAGVTEATAEDHYNEYGAAEGREPNSWFDADFYLLSNPDLIEAGLTRANALSHFAQFGVTEGRTFNSNPALDPSQFDAEDYAERYTDVAEAFGITDPADLTDEQAGQLMGHFLSYGMREGRTAEPASFNTAANGDMILVAGSDTVLGTSANDVFLWDQDAAWSEPSASVNGLGGTDELIVRNLDGNLTLTAAALENITIEGLAGNSALVVEGKGVQNVAVDTEDDVGTEYTFGYTGALVESIEVVGAGVVTAAFGKSANGGTDALELTLDLDGTFNVEANYGKSTNSGIEDLTLNIVEEGDNDGATVNLGAVNGDEVSVAINSEAAEIGVTINGTVHADNDDYSTITVDASGANGVAIELAAGLTGADVDVIQIGSDGRDFISTYAGIDTITGGEGNDVFDVAAGSYVISLDDDNDIDGIDTITDFENGDIIDAALVLQTADLTDVGTVAAGVLTFDYGYLTGKTFQDVVADLAAEGTGGSSLLFQFGQDAYVFTDDGALADAGLIKLAGVNVADLAISVDGVAFAPAV